MRWFLFCGFIIASWCALAEEPFPYECKSISISTGTVMLPADAPALVMMHNTSDTDLWITHPISDPSASAGWSSRLQSNRWSAFTLGSQAFELSCIESKPGHEQQVACSGVLTMCQWLGIKSTDKQPAPYWAGENMPLSELLGHLSQRGFQIPEPPKDKR